MQGTVKPDLLDTEDESDVAMTVLLRFTFNLHMTIFLFTALLFCPYSVSSSNNNNNIFLKTL